MRIPVCTSQRRKERPGRQTSGFSVAVRLKDPPHPPTHTQSHTPPQTPLLPNARVQLAYRRVPQLSVFRDRHKGKSHPENTRGRCLPTFLHRGASGSWRIPPGAGRWRLGGSSGCERQGLGAGLQSISQQGAAGWAARRPRHHRSTPVQQLTVQVGTLPPYLAVAEYVGGRWQ